jgi:hypothetical protein
MTMFMMTTLLMLAAQDTSAVPDPAAAAASAPLVIDCTAERATLEKFLKPILHPSGSLDDVADDIPYTLEYFYVSKLKKNAGRVSDDGQVIYIPDVADEAAGEALLAQALNNQMATKFGDACPPT